MEKGTNFIVGNKYKFNNVTVKVIAQNRDGTVAIEYLQDDNSGNLMGDVEVLKDIKIKDDMIWCSQYLYFGVDKNTFFEKIDKCLQGETIRYGLFGLRKKVYPPLQNTDTNTIVNALRRYYYKIPKDYLKLIVRAYKYAHPMLNNSKVNSR